MKPFATADRKRAAAAIARLGYPDEKVIELDRGNEHRSGINCDVIATNHAVYIREPGVRRLYRFGYDELTSVRIDDFELRGGRYPGHLDLVDKKGSRYSFDRVDHSNGLLPRYVRDAWARSCLADRGTSRPLP